MPPRVPILSDVSRSAPQPGVRVRSFDTSGEDLGRIGQSLNQVGEVVQQAQLRGQSIAFDQAALQIGEAVVGLERQALDTQREQAIGMPDKALGEMDAAAGKVIDGLGSEAVKQRARDWWRQQRLLKERSFLAHESQQVKQLDDETHAARMAQANRLAVGNPYDEVSIGSAIAERQRLIAEYHGRNGIGQDNDLTKNALAEATSATWASVVQARLDAGDDEGAEALYAAQRERIVPEHRADLEPRLEAATTAGKAQRLADELVPAGDGPAPEEDLSVEAELRALEQVRSQTSGRLEERSVAEVRARFAERRQATEERIRQATVAGVNAIVDAGSLTAALRVADQAPPELRLELIELAEQRYPRDTKAAQTAMALTVEAGIRRQIDGGQYRSVEEVIFDGRRLDPEQQEALADYYRKGGAAQDLTDTKVRSALKAVTGSDPSDREVGRFYNQIRRVLPADKEITYDAVYKAVASLAVEGTVTGDRELRRVEALEEGYSSFRPNLDAQERVDVLQVMEAAGVDPSSVAPQDFVQQVGQQARAIDDARRVRALDADTYLARQAETASVTLGETTAQGREALALQLEHGSAMGAVPGWMVAYLAKAGALDQFYEAMPVDGDRRAAYIQQWGARFLARLD